MRKNGGTGLGNSHWRGKRYTKEEHQNMKDREKTTNLIQEDAKPYCRRARPVCSAATERKWAEFAGRESSEGWGTV